MTRDENIEARADAILLADPMLKSWEERKPSWLMRTLRSIGSVLYLVTLGG